MTPLLDIQNLTKVFARGKDELVAVNDFNLTLDAERPQIVTIAGESGSGKSTVARLVLGIHTPTSGTVHYKGHDVHRLRRSERKTYLREVQAVFQDPYASYNPFYPVRHVFDVVIKNFGLASSKRDARRMIEEALATVGMAGSEVLHKYPHQLSGGQRQRMMMARAAMLKPSLVIADEPVSMVDASLRAMLLGIMQKLRDENGISFLYITHDLSTAYATTDRIYMMYQGTTTEKGPTRQVIDRPLHPYVRNLIEAIPRVDTRWEGRVEPSDEMSFGVDPRRGCPYAPRCPEVLDGCATTPLTASEPRPAHHVACHLYGGPLAEPPRGDIDRAAAP